ncbi:hypothetical protein K438DRAFT_1781912 [Mycena galopus ATCC 62051]|nr:hypothetical protein K438DRAFT_1781912 [Mycena galopus ATCC 62051]
MSLHQEILREAGRAMVEELFNVRNGRMGVRGRGYRGRSTSPPHSSYTGSSASSRGSSPPPQSWYNSSAYYDHGPRHDRRQEVSPNRRSEWPMRQRPSSPPRYQSDRRPDYNAPPAGHGRRDPEYGTYRGRPPRRNNQVREEHLRRAALSTLHVRGASAPSSITPSSTTARRDDRGHPIFPRALAAEEDTRLGQDAGISTPARYAENEATRHAQALANAAATTLPRTTMALTADRMGIWATAQLVTTFNEAVNLCRWVHHGDAHSMVYLKWAITALRDPTIRRTIGSVTLLQYQNQVINRYKAVVEGTHVPRSKVTNTGHTLGTGLPLHDNPLTMARMEHILPKSMDGDVPMPRADEEDAPPPRAYLGVAARNSDMAICVHLPESPAKGVMGRDITTASLEDAVKWYLAILTAHWPIGMRVSPSHAVELTVVSAAPLTGDVAAWLTLNALAPTRREMTAIHRNVFLRKAILILSVPGYFNHYAKLGHYPDDDLPLEHYPFDTTSLRWSHVVSWLIQHGIEQKSPPSQIFADEWPKATEDLALTTLGADDMWSMLQHGPICNGVDTFYPNYPVDTMEVPFDEDGNVINVDPPATPADSTITSTNTEG